MSRHSVAASAAKLLLALLAVSGCSKPASKPVADAGKDATANVGSDIQLDGSASADGQARALVFAWSFVSLPPGSHAALNEPHAVMPSFTADRAGKYEVQLVVNNGLLSSDPAKVTVTVAPCGGAAPKVTDVTATPATPNAGQVVTLAATATDADNSTDCNLAQTLALSWTLVSRPVGSNAVLSNPTVDKPTFVPDVVGTFQFQVVANDSTGLASKPGFLSVSTTGCGAGAAPTVRVTLSTETPIIDQTVTLTAVATDADNGPGCATPESFTYAWTVLSRPAGSVATLSSATGAAPTFTPDRMGSYRFQVVATDSTGLPSAPEQVTITTADCGAAAPSAAASASSVNPNVGDSVTLTSTVYDADNAVGCALAQTFTYSWSILSAPLASTASLSSSTAAAPTFTPAVVGTYVFEVVATDSTNRSSPPSFVTLTTTQCGTATPEVSASLSNLSPSIGETLTLTAVASDADNAVGCNLAQTLTYAWAVVSRPAGSIATLSSAAVAAPTFVPDVVGSYQFRVTATDATNRTSSPAVVTLTTSACGSASPSVTATASNLSPNITQLVTLTATPTDADNAAGCALGQTFTFGWTVLSRPTGSTVTFSSATVAAPTFSPDVVGSYQFQVVATDSTNRVSAPALVTLATSNCGASAPAVVATASSLNPVIGQAVTLTAVGTDADNGSGCGLGQTFTYAWAILSRPAGSTAALSSATVAAPGFTPDVVGSYQFQVVATDSTNRVSAPAVVTLATSTCGTASPSVSATASAESPNVGQSVTLTAVATDADNGIGCALGQGITYAWSVLSKPAGSAAALSSTTVAAPTFTPDVPGGYLMQVVATDATGRASAAALVNLTTSACGTANPGVVASASNAAPNITQTVTLTAAPSDADNGAGCGLGQTFTFAWSVLSRPTGSLSPLSSLTAAAPTFSPDVVGTYQFQVVATDSTSRASAPAVVTVSTTACGTTAPVVAATVSPSNPSLGQPVLLTAAVSDVDNGVGCNLGQTFTYAWTLVSAPGASTATLSSTSVVAPTFTPDVVGTFQFRVVATDSTNRASAPAMVTFTLTATGGCGSAVPAVAAWASTTNPNITQSVTLAAVVTDADNGVDCNLGQTFTYAWTILSKPAGSVAALSSATVVSPSFTSDVVGSYEFRVVATDSTNRASSPALVTLATSSCGTASPTVAATASNANPNITQLVTLTASPSDADNGPGCGLSQTFTYAWTLSSKPAGSVTALSSATAAAPTFTPDVVGSYQFEVVATDSTSRASAPAVVTLVTSACGTASPTVAATVSNANPNITQGVTLTATPSDSDNGTGCSLAQTFTYAWSLLSKPAGSAAALSSAIVAAPTFTPDLAGSYQFQVVATDSTGRASAPALVGFTTTACGTASPTVAATVSNANPNITQLVTLTATPSDSDNGTGCGLGQTFTYAWSIVSKPAGSVAVLGGAATAAATFTPDVVGPYQFKAVVTDSTLRTGSSTVTLSTSVCGANRPMALALAAVTGNPLGNPVVGSTVNLSAQLTDDDNAAPCSLGQIFTYAWSVTARPTGSVAALSSAVAAAPTFSPDVAGAYTFRVVVTDSLGLASQPSTVTIGQCGTWVPTAKIGVLSPVTVPAGTSISTSMAVSTPMQVDGSASIDPALGSACSTMNPLQYQWYFMTLPPSTSSFGYPQMNNGGIAAPTVVLQAPGRYVIGLIVSSAGVSSSPATLTVDIAAPFIIENPISGPFTAMALEPGNSPNKGNPVVAYFDNNVGQVRVARCTANCASQTPTWVYLPTVESGIGTIGGYNGFTGWTNDDPQPVAIAVSATLNPTDGMGTPIVAYHVPLSCAIHVASRNAAGTGWNIAVNNPPIAGDCTWWGWTPGGPGQRSYGRWLSMALDGVGNPAIAFWSWDANTSSSTLNYARCSAGCLTAFPAFFSTTIEPPSFMGPTTIGTGTWPSLHFTAAGNPRLAYLTFDNATTARAPRYAECNVSVPNANCTNPGSFAYGTVESTGNLGYYTSLAVASTGLPQIVYHDQWAGTMRYAVCTGAPCTSAANWSTRVAASNWAGGYASLALTATDQPRVANFHRGGTGGLYLDAANGGPWTSMQLDPLNWNAGQFVSLALSSFGNPWMAYYDPNQQAEKFMALGP